jgi:hypothetical protein
VPVPSTAVLAVLSKPLQLMFAAIEYIGAVFAGIKSYTKYVKIA